MPRKHKASYIYVTGSDINQTKLELHANWLLNHVAENLENVAAAILSYTPAPFQTESRD